jgi:hypothetical protein
MRDFEYYRSSIPLFVNNLTFQSWRGWTQRWHARHGHADRSRHLCLVRGARRGLHGMGVHGVLMLITHSPGVPLFARAHCARCRSAQCARAGHSRHWHARCARAGHTAIGHALLPGMAWACTYVL